MIEILIELARFTLAALVVLGAAGVLVVLYSLGVCWWLTKDPDA